MAVHQNRSVGRTLTILELLGNTNKALTLTEIARAADLDASTAYRILRVLCSRGFVHRIDATRRYVLSLNAFRLGSPDRVVQGIGNRTRLSLLRLAKELNEDHSMAVLEASGGALLRRSRRRQTRICKCWERWSMLTRRRQERRYSPRVRVRKSSCSIAARQMHTYTDRTLKTVPALLNELAAVRTRGLVHVRW